MLLVAVMAVSPCTPAESTDPASGFKNPPREAGVRCWWWWLNSNVTKEAITRDLEAMHDKGFSGAMIFDAGTELRWGPDRNVPNGPRYASPAWTKLYLHALKEARRLGLKLGLSIQSGWNLGGPMVTLDDTAKQLTWSEITITGPAAITRKLPVPKHNYKYYRDICVLAYPNKREAPHQPFKIRASSSQRNFPASRAADGDGDTFWVSAGKKPGEGPTPASPEWIEFTLDKPAVVSGLHLAGRKGYGPKACRVTVDGARNGTKVFALKDGANRISFDPVEGQSFRVLFEGAYDSNSPDAPRNVQLVTVGLLDTDGNNLVSRGGKARKPISHLAAKSGARELGGSAPDCRFLLNDHPAVPGEEDTLPNDIVAITDTLSEDGTLTWDAPAGRWTVLRIGYTPTRAHVKTSSDNWKGHVLDYLSKDAFDRYWYDVVDPLLKKAGPMAGTVLTQLETDSWECGGMNWSANFARDFTAYCGYDILKYLPVVAGKIVESRAVSNAFLADLRKTIGHLVSEKHYRTFAEHAARYNMGIQPECSGPHAAPLDGIKNYAHNDIVMSEFWIPSPHRPDPENRFFVKQASSAAHIYGKKIVGAESFTSLKKPHWAVTLWSDLKPAMDFEYCEGLNMIFFHTFTCSPKEMGVPGQEYFAGTHVNPQVTWWDYSDTFMDYMNRIQRVVQQGTFVADVLYYYGDHVPNIAVNKGFNRAGALPGYDYDVTNEDVLLQLAVVDGAVVVPGGIHYRVLVLPDHKVLSLAALEKVQELLEKGATVIGPKPARLVSLVGGAAAQRTFHALADELWGENPAATGTQAAGEGTLVWGRTSRAFLQSDGVAPDFAVVGAKKQLDYQYIHYTVDGADVYFVCNQTAQPKQVTCAFRVSGRQPERWDPVTGDITAARAFEQADGRTFVPLAFDPFGSCLVVFKNAVPVTKNGTERSNHPVRETACAITGPWQVGFDPAWGGPASVVFKELTDWTRHTDTGIKYYSGAATYATAFDITPDTGKRYWLQLNRVADVGIAAVTLNGKDAGITWTSPFRVDITDELTAGKNRLDVTVVNSWQNRLIGDRGAPREKRYTQTNIKIRSDWKLRPSGLLGPVVVLAEKAR